MPYTLFLLFATAFAARADLVEQIEEFFNGDQITFARPDWAEEVDALDPVAARDLLLKLNELPHLRVRAEMGQDFLRDVLTDVARQDITDFYGADVFEADALRWIADVETHQGRPDYHLAEANAARSLGHDVAYFLRGENRDVRKLWQTRVEQELRRAEQLRDRQLPIARLRLWRAVQWRRFNYLTFSVRGFLMRSMEHLLEVRNADAGRVSIRSMKEILNGNVRLGAELTWESKTNSTEAPDLSILSSDGSIWGVHWREGGKPFKNTDRRPSFFGTASLHTTYETGHFEMIMARIRELDAILLWLHQLPPKLSPDEMRAKLMAMTSRVRAERTSVEDWVEDYRKVDKRESFAPRLADFLVGLSWSRLYEDEAYWDKYDELTEGRPKLSLRTRESVEPVTLDLFAAPPRPPPISNLKTETFYEISRENDHELPGVFRWQVPSDSEGDAWTEVAPAEGDTQVSLRPVKSLKVSDGWLAIPTPLHHALSEVRVFGPEGPLTAGEDFKTWRSTKSRAFAVHLKSSTIQAVALIAGFRAEAIAPTPAPPLVSGAVWRDLEVALRLAGDRKLAGDFAKVKRLDAAEISNLVRRRTKYTYHPENLVPEGLGPFGPLSPFLDDHGQFCIQCKHASTYLLLPMLKRVYRDHPDFSFASRRFLLRSGETLIYPAHAAVEVFWRGHLHGYLDPTPDNYDERAPEPDALTKREEAEKNDERRERLREFLGEMLARAGKIWPAHLPPDAPVHALRRLAERVIAGDIVSRVELDQEMERIERWRVIPVDRHRLSVGVSRFFETMDGDFKRLAREIGAIIARDCENELARS